MLYFKKEAEQILSQLEAEGEDAQPWVLLLNGDLGAGKTTFVKTLLEEISPGAGEEVQSPTFLKLIEYGLPGFGKVVHIDAYRMQEDMESWKKLSLESYSDAKLWLIEWPNFFIKILREESDLRSFLGIKKAWLLDFEIHEKENAPAHNPVERTLAWREIIF